MCQYIKDNGEQCGMDAEPFCHMHEDSEQAEQWRDQKRSDYGAVSGAQSDSSGIEGADSPSASSPPETAVSGVEMDTVCDQCESPLRRVERLSDHENLGGQMMFVAAVECDCSEHVLGTQPVRFGKLPEGWTE